jgi:hypothetical protein
LASPSEKNHETAASTNLFTDSFNVTEDGLAEYGAFNAAYIVKTSY